MPLKQNQKLPSSSDNYLSPEYCKTADKSSLPSTNST